RGSIPGAPEFSQTAAKLRELHALSDNLRLRRRPPQYSKPTVNELEMASLEQNSTPKTAARSHGERPPRRLLANAVRMLAADAVERAKSGHPGMPMGMADIAEVLWNDYLKFNPANPEWNFR